MTAHIVAILDYMMLVADHNIATVDGMSITKKLNNIKKCR